MALWLPNPIQSKIIKKTGFNALATTFGDMNKDSFVLVRNHVQSSCILGLWAVCGGGSPLQKDRALNQM